MPHADASLVPPTISTKSEFWDHVHEQLSYLLEDQRHWVSNLANASALIYHSLLAFSSHFGSGDRAVNWCGFYLTSTLFPKPHILGKTSNDDVNASQDINSLLLGPFCGKPACQFINVAPDNARGVCAEAFLQGKIILVQDVDAYPGHIACDGDTKSEIVCPLILRSRDEQRVIGVLDLDCLALSGFDEEDRAGLEKIAELVVKSCDW
ncbi:GAF domain-like protein [Phlebopus sp. FC_14]|nr:GAF domain-like protein [Phlebopus sp. FC_14]